MAIAKEHLMTITQLEKGEPTDPIWALNGSATSKVRANGDVHVGIPKANGTKVDGLHLPQTWLPCNLTDKVPRRQLLDASEFRNAVGSGLIILITEDYANLLNEQDGAEEERQRLNEREQQILDATSNALKGNSEIVSVDELSDLSGLANATPKADPATELTANFTMFVESLKEKPDVDALNLIRGRGQFKKAELRHMAKELRGKSKVIDFLQPFLD